MTLVEVSVLQLVVQGVAQHICIPYQYIALFIARLARRAPSFLSGKIKKEKSGYVPVPVALWNTSRVLRTRVLLDCTW